MLMKGEGNLPFLQKENMLYIKITNKAQEVNRLKLEKLGFSTKRNDESTIGQFGSGIKFAPISAIRRGIDFVFAGNDTKGPYVLRYIIKDEEGIPSVYYKYNEYEKSSSFTADAGNLSWENDFQIYREVVANAIDEAKISNTDWTIDIVDVDDIEPNDGEFSVYLLATESMLEIHKNFDKYFSVNRKPIHTVKGKKIYDSIDGSLRVYCKGMLVYSDEQRVEKFGGNPSKSFFDYEIDDLKLNEERTVLSEYQLNREIIEIITLLDDESLVHKIMKIMLSPESVVEEYYELGLANYLYDRTIYHGEEWLKVFEEHYPKSIIVDKDHRSFNMITTIKAKGYYPISVQTENCYKFLSTSGIPDFKEIFGEAFVYEYSMDFSMHKNMVEAIEIISSVYPEFVEVIPSIGVYRDNEEDALGITVPSKDEDGNSIKIILIEQNHASSDDIPSIIGTIIHEWDHFKTSIGDGDIEGRMFRSLADTRIGHLIYSLSQMNARV